MIIAVTIIHVIVSIGLILVVLLQAGKGADMGAVFGGASSTIFGSSGAGNFLTRLTTGAAIVFMTTSLGLTWAGSHGGHSTIMPEKGSTHAVEQPATAAPGDGEAAAVADSAPAGDVPPAGEAAAPAANTAPAPAAAGEAAAPAAQAPAAAPAAP